MSQLSLKSLSKSYGSFEVFKGLNLEADAGEIVVIFGGSGTGKTILLRLIAGVEDPTTGTVELDGHNMADIPPESRDVGMAFQNFALFPHMSAHDNIAAPLRARSVADSAIVAGVNRVAKLLKIDLVLGHAPRELSNGQKQRTSLARALAAEPKFLLLDDPLRNVDAKLRYEMRLELPRLLRQSGATVLYVTQDYKEAMALADRIAVLQGGMFVQLATPQEIYEKPATLQVARLFGDPVINTLDATISQSGRKITTNFADFELNIADDFRSHIGEQVVLAVRPDAVSLNSYQRGVTATVMAITPLNERTVLFLHAENNWEFLVSLPSSVQAPKAGSKVTASFNTSAVHIFNKQTGERLNG